MMLSFSKMITRRYRSLATAPKFLDNFLGISFGATETPRQSPDLHKARSGASISAPALSTGSMHLSMRTFLAQLFSADNREVQVESNGLHNHLSVSARRIDTLESLLKAERKRSRLLTQELLTARAALKRLDELRSDLEVERESGRLLVQFLEEAEREAGKVQDVKALVRQRDDAGGQTLAGTQSIAQGPEMP
jgi:hypothetical protein